MDSLDIQIVDNLTVNLNQEEYSTEGQVLNGIDVYVEDEQLLFEAALTQDSINLYTRETPDIISFDTKGIMDGISKLESLILKTSKEATLLAKVAELKKALNTIDFTAIEQAIQDVEDVTAKEVTLIQGVEDIIKAVENIDFTDLENSIAEVKNAVANIDLSALAKEDTLTQGISSVESKVEEESQAIQSKIDNIKLPEIDTTELAKESTLNAVSSKLDNLNVEVDLSTVAKQGDNADATNTAIYALLSQFGESVLQEAVTVICNCAEDIAWEEYGVVITYADGTSQSLPMSENGTCSFSVKIGQEYSVQLPVIGAYIAPTKKTYTASTSSRQIYWSYVVSGVFGLDEQGRRYTIEQIEALEDKSIIKYGGYTDDFLENSSRDDGGVGNGFMWLITQQPASGVYTSANVEFSQELLPFITTIEESLPYCNGAAYTRYMLSEAARLGITSPMAQQCIDTTITMQGQVYHGYAGAFQQYYRWLSNRTQITLLYSLVGIEVPSLLVGGNKYFATSNQASAEKRVSIYTCDVVNKNSLWVANKSLGYYQSFPIFDLPK